MDDDDRDHGAPDPHDVGDDQRYDGGGRSSPTDPTDPLERFIQQLQSLSAMDGPDISAALDDLPMPQIGHVPSMSVHEAAEVIVCDICDISYVI